MEADEDRAKEAVEQPSGPQQPYGATVRGRRSPRLGKLGGPLAIAAVAALVLAALGGPGTTLEAQDGGTAAASHGTAHPAATHGAASATTPAPIHVTTVGEGAPPVPLWQRFMSGVGLLAMVGLAWLMSTNRRVIPWRIVGWGLGLQLAFGLFVLKTPVGMALFRLLNDVVTRLLDFTHEGSAFIFGKYVDQQTTFALNVLPTIIFFSSLMAVLYHLGVMQRLVRGFAWVMQRTMGTSGAETLSAAANIFVGQTEAPLVVRPYVESMTQSS